MKFPSMRLKLGAAEIALLFSAIGGLVLTSACGAPDGEPGGLRSAEQAFGPPVTAVLQQGQSGYAGAKDATIQQKAASTNAGAATSCEIDGNDGNGADKSCLLSFSLSSVPAGSQITGVSLQVRVLDPSSNPYEISELLRPFDQATVTWQAATAGAPWGAPGAQGSSDRGPVLGTITGASRSSVTVDLGPGGVDFAQTRLDAGDGFDVIIAHTTHSNGLDLASSEHRTQSYRPALVVTYLPPEPAGTGGASSGGTSSGGASSGGTSSGGASSGGTSSGGASPSGGAGGSGTGGSGNEGGASTEPNLLVAFIGDQGNNSNSDAVLQLIKNEGAAATLHNGDFDYADNPTAFENRVNAILGANYPYFAVVGNHDAAAWGGANGYGAKIAARVARVPEMQCTGEHGVHADCLFRGLHLIQSCVGTSELRSNCSANSAVEVNFLRDALASSDAVWEICSWHKNQRDFQVGTKADEVGWSAYQVCMAGGAIVATGHEHSYARTLSLTDVGNPATGHGASGAYDTLLLGPDKNFVFVSGLGGVGLRPFSTTYHNDDTWWASYLTSDRWFENGVMRSGSGTYGALFIRFHVDGNPNKATGYFKDVNGRVADQFTIYRE